MKTIFLIESAYSIVVLYLDILWCDYNTVFHSYNFAGKIPHSLDMGRLIRIYSQYILWSIYSKREIQVIVWIIIRKRHKKVIRVLSHISDWTDFYIFQCRSKTISSNNLQLPYIKENWNLRSKVTFKMENALYLVTPHLNKIKDKDNWIEIQIENQL